MTHDVDLEQCDILYYAHIARLVYQDPAAYRDTDVRMLDGSLPTFIDVNDCHAMIFERRGALVIAFRGSDSDTDIYRVMKAHLRPFILGDPPISCGMVHAGFYEYYMNLRNASNQYIDDYLQRANQQAKIVFVGHSLGSSCVLAALECAMRRPRPHVMCYTYGSPRVGDFQFSTILARRIEQKNLIRVVNRRDMVTRMPSTSCGCCLFVHPRGGHEVGKNTSLRCFLFEIIFFVVMCRCVYMSLLEHHDIDAYIEALS